MKKSPTGASAARVSLTEMDFGGGGNVRKKDPNHLSASVRAKKKMVGVLSKIFSLNLNWKMALFPKKGSNLNTKAIQLKKTEDYEQLQLNKLEFMHYTEKPIVAGTGSNSSGKNKSKRTEKEKENEMELEKQELLAIGNVGKSSPKQNLHTVSTSSSKSVPSQDKKRKESSNRVDDKDKDMSEEDLDFYSDNPRYVKKKEQEIRERRLAAGENLEDINRDLKEKRLQMKKKGVARSPMPPGGM